MTDSFKTDAIIFGGGIAGLWLLNRLHNEGYRALLLEQDKLGAGQSIASQGMIHGGLKYALGGKMTGASTTIADMPAHWKKCLAGEGDVDLRGCNLLSDRYYMWPRDSIRSRLNAFLGSKALEARVDKIDQGDYPAFFKDHIPGPLYRLQDIVLDVPSLLQTLYEKQKENIRKIDWNEATLLRDQSGNIEGLQFSGGTLIRAQRYIFCCGAGAEELMKRFDLNIAGMQRRPLQMAMVKHQIREPVYVHCVSDKLSMTPEVTITTHRNAAGEPVWYLGGELAEQGASQSAEELISHAAGKLAELFPWCDFGTATWGTLSVDRAEEKQSGGNRPDNVSIAVRGNLMVCWPTKLTLAPNLAGAVMDRFTQDGIAAQEHAQAMDLSFLGSPGIAPTPWEHL